MADEFPIKKYCHENNCKIVRTGFHLENYPVCQTCLQEVSETMYEYHKRREAMLEAREEVLIILNDYNS